MGQVDLNKDEESTLPFKKAATVISESESISKEGEEQKPLVRRTGVVRGVPISNFDSLQFNPDFLSFERISSEIESDQGQSHTQRSRFADDNYSRYVEDIRSRDLDNYPEPNEPIKEDIYTDKLNESLSLDEVSYEQSSTITPSEKRAFQKIFKDIFERKQKSETLSIYGESFAAPESESDDNQHNLQQEIDQGLNEIIYKSIQSPLDKKKAIHAKIEKFPSSLRGTAAEAFGLEKIINEELSNLEDQSESNVSLSCSNYDTTESILFGNPDLMRERAQKLEMEKRLESIQEMEQERVEAQMRAAATDFKLWEVLEEEVFSLIGKLGLEDPPSTLHTLPRIDQGITSQKMKKKRKSLTDKSMMESLVPLARPKSYLAPSPSPVKKHVIPDSLASKHNVSPLQLYGPLYPYYLLLALRLLDRSFSRPSPLALALLPRIKSLGYISRVLGANTQLYNELLLIYRFRQNDFNGMIRLLEEMEMSSLLMSQETLDIVVQLSRIQDRVRQGSQGLGMSMLWGLPNFARGKFGPWRDYIRDVLESQKQTRRVLQSHMRPSSYP